MKDLFSALALSIALTALTGCSKIYGSKIEAKNASLKWEAQGGEVTIKTTKTRVKSIDKTITLTEDEYQAKLKINQERTRKYIDYMKPQWEEADRNRKRLLLEKFPYLKGMTLNHTLWDDYPEEAEYDLRLGERLEPQCVDTDATVCVARRKIGTVLPERKFKKTEFKNVKYTEESSRNLRECSYEAEVETRQYVCVESGFKKDAIITSSDWEKRRLKYHYFRF